MSECYKGLLRRPGRGLVKAHRLQMCIENQVQKESDPNVEERSPKGKECSD